MIIINSLWNEIIQYFSSNADSYFTVLKEHIVISGTALLLAIFISIVVSVIALRYRRLYRLLVTLFQSLRIIPSLAVILLLLPIMGTGFQPALCALVLLGIPAILMNLLTAYEEVPDFLIESAYGIGMDDVQVLWKVKVPSMLPLFLTGVRTAMIEIIASASIAAKIGAGGLGGLIFTGIGLQRNDLLVIGGVSVALLSILCGWLIKGIQRLVLPYKYRKGR